MCTGGAHKTKTQRFINDSVLDKCTPSTASDTIATKKLLTLHLSTVEKLATYIT
jgi:hypothetical protein